MMVQLQNDRIFEQETECPLISYPVLLYANTWNEHIVKRHPEIESHLSNVQNLVKSPDMVAKSRSGPGNKHVGNYVFVGKATTLRTAIMHVFVENPETAPVVSTVIFARKPFYGEVLWRANDTLTVDYDVDRDVLYLSKDEPKEALSDVEDDGLILRSSVVDDAPCGITVIGYHTAWSDHIDDLINRISVLLKVSHALAQEAITSTR